MQTDQKIIKARVCAGSRKESFVATSTTNYQIAVREKAEDNRANRRVIELLARHLGIPQKSIRIIRGHRYPSKVFAIGVR